jgi:hypothetical protein
MMKKNSLRFFVLPAILLLMTFLVACAFRPGAMARRNQGSMAQDAASTATALADQNAAEAVGGVEETATLTPVPTIARPTPTATALGDTTRAQQAAVQYFEALVKGDAAQAASQVSSYSLMVFSITRGDAAGDLQTQRGNGARWAGLNVPETKVFDDHTILVHVTYTYTTKDPKTGKDVDTARDEWWPFRLENGAWRYNWNNLIDYKTLGTAPQTMNGITILPVRLMRYADRTQLVMVVQNRTNAAVVFGQANEILGTFHFGDQQVVAEKEQIILNPLRSVPDVTLEAKGLFTSYPESIEIRKWKSYNVQPWYVFQLQ